MHTPTFASRFSPVLFASGALFASALIVPGTVDAATFDWRGPTSNDWLTGSNWRIGSTFQTTPPTSTDSVTINNGGTAACSPGSSTITGMTIGTFGGNLTVQSGGVLTSGFASISGTSSTVMTVTGSGSEWNNGASYLRLGVGTGTGTLVIADGGKVSANSGAGTLTLGYNSATATGVVKIGNGSSAGVLNAATVASSTGAAEVIFNHTSSGYYFTTTGTSSGTGVAITGTTKVSVSGGTTRFTSTGNTYTGDTTISSSSNLTFAANNTASAGSRVILGGGSIGFETGNFSQGSSTVIGLGALALTASSILDFGDGNQLLHFADSSAQTWTGTLAVHNWGTGDSLYVGIANTALTSAQLNQISFYSDAGSTLLGTGDWLGTSGQLTYSAIPEPGTVALIAGGASLLVCACRRRRRLPA